MYRIRGKVGWESIGSEECAMGRYRIRKKVKWKGVR